ncbi:MAG: hypothetical protein A2900_00905 [Candidatus Chisholmbacteria bacterium RIFCSPLOWO2_01_FULL_50_28]|nr:MAG: hypothetical protein A2900_00905 [Candidatus Chisholmbacteria bacterium RIFCSPLOWO2_01_FULL_50_28]
MGKITSRKYCLPQIVKKRQFPCLAIILLTLIVWFAVFHPPNSYAALVKPGGSPNTFADLEPIVGNIIKVSVALAGIALFAMLLLGGIQYLSSGGDPKAVQQAKSTLTYGIVGVALLVLAWFVLLFIEQFTGVKVTIFTLPSS